MKLIEGLRVAFRFYVPIAIWPSYDRMTVVYESFIIWKILEIRFVRNRWHLGLAFMNWAKFMFIIHSFIHSFSIVNLKIIAAIFYKQVCCFLWLFYGGGTAETSLIKELGIPLQRKALFNEMCNFFECFYRYHTHFFFSCAFDLKEVLERNFLLSYL